MSKKLLFVVLALLFLQSAQAQKAVHIKINLSQLNEGMLNVSVSSAAVRQDTLVYAMPKIVPGTYSIANYGRMVRNLEAFDTKGKALAVTQLDDNRWQIAGARLLDRITYSVASTFTDPAGRHIFEPAGTRFEAGENFVLNNFGVAGYFEGFSDLDYHFEVTRPLDFYGASALSQKQLNDSTDLFAARGYFDFHDSPVMYARPDTAGFYVGDTHIFIACYSPGNNLSAPYIREQVRDIMEGAAAYLGGKLPVDRYVILMSLISGMTNSGGFGALEHNYSTVFVLPEMSRDFLAQTIKDVTAHEFFHIVTPLNIHSEHIHDYNFS